MIVDTRAAGFVWPSRYDVCVVGAGPAGLAVALTLARAGRRVCVLEAGGSKAAAASQRMLVGELTNSAFPPLSDMRVAGLGGSTQVWAGWCRPMDASDFAANEALGHPGWPMSLSDLLTWYDAAVEYLGVPVFDFAANPQASFPDNSDFEHRQFLIHRVNPAQQHEEFLSRNPNLTVALHAQLLRLTLTGDRVSGATIKTQGATIELGADCFVLATGGIENPRLLLLSAQDSANAPGNRHNLVGRYFADHAYAEIGSLTSTNGSSLAAYDVQQQDPSTPQSTTRAVWSLSPEAVKRTDGANCGIFVKPAYETHPAFRSSEVRALLEFWDKRSGKAAPGNSLSYLTRALSRPDRLFTAIRRKLLDNGASGNTRHLRAMFETSFRYDNQVSLSNRPDASGRPLAQLRWSLADSDVTRMRHMIQHFDAALKASGAARFDPVLADSNDAWRAVAEAGKHHMGTTRMHSDPRQGVVDANSRVHGVQNLYVAGSSVFPSGSWVNPTLTLLALALRLGSHLDSCLAR